MGFDDISRAPGCEYDSSWTDLQQTFSNRLPSFTTSLHFVNTAHMLLTLSALFNLLSSAGDEKVHDSSRRGWDIGKSKKG